MLAADYQSRAVYGFIRPIEFNHAGQQLNLAVIGETYELKPFGPHSPARCKATVSDISEEREQILLSDRRQELWISFDRWACMQPRYVG